MPNKSNAIATYEDFVEHLRKFVDFGSDYREGINRLLERIIMHSGSAFPVEMPDSDLGVARLAFGWQVMESMHDPTFARLAADAYKELAEGIRKSIFEFQEALERTEYPLTIARANEIAATFGRVAKEFQEFVTFDAKPAAIRKDKGDRDPWHGYQTLDRFSNSLAEKYCDRVSDELERLETAYETESYHVSENSSIVAPENDEIDDCISQLDAVNMMLKLLGYPKEAKNKKDEINKLKAKLRSRLYRAAKKSNGLKTILADGEKHYSERQIKHFAEHHCKDLAVNLDYL